MSRILTAILFFGVLLFGVLPDSSAHVPARITASTLPPLEQCRDAGNTTSDGYWDYTWDGYNRLTKVESKANAPIASRRSIVFKYDSGGRRIARVTSAADASGVYRETDSRKFVYNGWKLVAELNGTNNAVIRKYLWAGNQLLAINQNNIQYLPTFDGQGNVMSLIQADNLAVVARYDYSPFGILIKASGPMALENPIRFSSEYQDDVTGFIYYGYRYYNPTTQTWLSRDAVGMAGGFNLYALVDNDPVNGRDYLGLATYLSETATILGIPLPPSVVGYRVPENPLSLIDQAEAILALPAEAIMNAALVLDSVGTAVTTPVTGMNLQDTLLAMPLVGPEGAAIIGELKNVVALSRARIAANVCSFTARAHVVDVVASERMLVVDLAVLKMESRPLTQAAKTPVQMWDDAVEQAAARVQAAKLEGGGYNFLNECEGTLAAKTATAAAPGARVTIGGVQATEIAGRLTPAQMAALQAEHGTEFAQIYLTGPGRAGGGGTYYLIQGAEGTVQVPIGSNVRWINHTHPELLQGGVVPLEASGADYYVLRLLQQARSPQRTSQIVPEVGTPFNFRR